MIQFATFFKEAHKFEKELSEYAAKGEVNEVYFSARQFLDQISMKAVHNKVIRLRAYEYFVYGGTVRLKKILSYTDFNESDIVHFNGFSLIDSVMAARK